MNHAQFRWLLVALAGVLVGYVVVRRRRQLVEALPQPLVEQAERFVIPWPTSEHSPSETLAEAEAAVNKAVDAAKQAVDKGVDATKQAVGKGVDTVRQTVEDATEDAEDATEDAEDADEGEGIDSPRRKVSATHRISYGGKRYGPLPESLVGEYVEIESSNGKLNVLHAGKAIASFDLE